MKLSVGIPASAAALALTLAAGPALATPPQPAQLTVKSTEGALTTFSSQFPPTKLLVQRAVPWNTLPGTVEPPVQEFSNTAPAILTAELSFDSHESGQDVADFVAPLEQLTTVDVSLGRPRIVLLQFGGFTFKGVLLSVEVAYSQFEDDATKERATVKFVIRGASAAMSAPR
jgi:hypothetical protein